MNANMGVISSLRALALPKLPMVAGLLQSTLWQRLTCVELL
jgi:hypothetical protein